MIITNIYSKIIENSLKNGGATSMDKQNINVAILGFGGIGKVHAYAIENLKYFASDLPFRPRVLGVCTTSEEKSARICENMGFEKAYKSVFEAIEDPDVDVVDICLPNHLHADAVSRAIAANKHVLCEKPLCPTYKESKRALDEAVLGGICHGVVFHNRSFSAIQKAKQLIDAGRLGRILSFEASYLHNSCLDTNKRAGWKQSGSLGAGVLRDLGSHVLDLVYYLCGEFYDVSARTQIAFPERVGSNGDTWHTDGDEAVYITATLKNGACGTVNASKLICGANDDLSLRIYGETGSLSFSYADLDGLYFYDSTRPSGVLGGERGYTRIECGGRYPEPFGSFPSPKAPQGWLRAHAYNMYSFLNAVYDGNDASPSFADGMYIAAVCDAAYLSAKEGRAVKLDEVII